MICRLMTLEDLDQVMHVELMSFNTPWSIESFYNELTQNHLARYLVIELDEIVVGYGGYWRVVDEGHITNVAIDPVYRGRGLSKHLVEALIADARLQKIHSMTLEVRVNNLVAINLYKRFAFESVGIRPKYYYDTGEDALIMWANIESDGNDENTSN